MIDINEIASKIIEKKDDILAKAFTMQIGMLLRENGIIPIATEYTKQDIDNITNANERRLVYEYGVYFGELDTSEHDKKVRAKTIEEVEETYIDVICEDCSKCGGHCRHDDVMNMFERLKEQK